MRQPNSISMAVFWFCLISLGLGAFSGPVQAGGNHAAEKAYQQARKAYYLFKADKKKQKLRHHWQKTAAGFERVAEKHKKSARAADALFTAGRLYYDLYGISRVEADLDRAVEHFEQLVDEFPANGLADDGQLYIALQYLEYRKNKVAAAAALARLVERFPKGDCRPRAKRMLSDLGGPPSERQVVKADASFAGWGKPKQEDAKSGEAQEPEESKTKTAVLSVKTTEHDGPAVLNRIHHDSGADYARVTLYTGSQVPYKFGRLPATQKRPNPRIYIDLKGAHLDPHLKKSIVVGSGVLKRIRFGPFKQDVVRVVLDLKALGDLKVVPMDSPARIIVDVSASADKVASIIGAKIAKPNKVVPKTETKPKTKPKIKPKIKPKTKPRTQPKTKPKTKPRIPSKKASRPGASLSMLAGLKIRRIAIDAGHGGRDPGAIGPKGTFEKTLTLDIAKRLAKLLKKDKKLALKEVILTRDRDKYVALEKRTAIANAKKSDLFISIHCNANRNRRFRGVETFYLDLTNDRYSIKLAARENATTEKTISDLRYILADLALKSHVDDSISLGRAIQKATVGKLRRHHKRIKDLRIKPALFYVLIGARMPSVLVETSFISNPEEEKRLRTAKYRQQIAQGIYRGIVNFVAERDRLLDPNSK